MEGSLSFLEGESAGRRRSKEASSLRLTHPVGHHHPPITLSDMRVAPLEEASSRRLDLFGGKDNPFLSVDISNSIEPNRDGVRGRAAILWGMGLKAVRMNTANLCSSACSPTTSWVWGFGSGHVVVRSPH